MPGQMQRDKVRRRCAEPGGFDWSKISRFRLSGADLTGAKFRKTVIAPAAFERTEWWKADFRCQRDLLEEVYASTRRTFRTLRACMSAAISISRCWTSSEESPKSGPRLGVHRSPFGVRRSRGIGRRSAGVNEASSLPLPNREQTEMASTARIMRLPRLRDVLTVPPNGERRTFHAIRLR